MISTCEGRALVASKIMLKDFRVERLRVSSNRMPWWFIYSDDINGRAHGPMAILGAGAGATEI